MGDLVEYGFGADPHFEAVIAEVDAKPAGMALFFRSFSTWNGRPGAYVQDIYVDDAYRGLGIGAKLLRRVAAIIRDRGGCYMRLSVDTENFAAQGFYSRLDLVLSDSEQIHAAYGEAFLNLARQTARRAAHFQARRSDHEGLLCSRAEAPRSEGFPVEWRAAAEPGTAGARRTLACRREASRLC